MDIPFQVNLTLADKRCWICGRFYAVETSFKDSASCPYCRSARLNEAIEQLERANRKIAALKGVINRSRTRKS